MEAQRITNVNDILLLRSWACTKIGELLSRWILSPRRVDKIDGERVEGLSTIGWLRLAPMAPMASMVVLMAQEGAHVEVSLVPLGVFDTEGADVEVPLCGCSFF